MPTTREVTATNDAVAGFTTKGDYAACNCARTPMWCPTSRGADVVEIGVSCRGSWILADRVGRRSPAHGALIPAIEHNLAEIIARVRELTAGHPVLLVLLDYWNVWLGGQYAEPLGSAYVDAADTVTDQVNTVIKATAAESGSAYVDLRAAFKGPDYEFDETHYLSNDGNDPNAAGHEQIAAAVVDVVTQTLHVLSIPVWGDAVRVMRCARFPPASATPQGQAALMIIFLYTIRTQFDGSG